MSPKYDKILFTDTETFNEVDIKKAGAIKYTDTAEMLLAGFLLGDRYEVWDYQEERSIPTWVFQHVNNGGLVCAHNMLFDYDVLRKHIPSLKLEQCIDTMALCAVAGLPLGLEKAGDALGLSPDKQKLKDGKRLVSKFCVPRTPSKNNPATRVYPQDAPEDWAKFRDDYLRLDIESMVEIFKLLPPLTDQEQTVWTDTQKINMTGVPVDVPLAKKIHARIDKLVDDEGSKFVRLTGIFPGQRDKTLAWVRKNGVKVGNLQAATVAQVLADESTPKIVADALTARANTTHMSFKKYDTILAATMADGRIRGTLMYHAATTGRFGGRLLQTQNLARGSIDGEEAVDRIKAGEFDVELVKSAVRPMIYHPDGLTIVDYASIEARIVQWIAGDEVALDVFRENLDPYKWMAQKIYGVSYDEVTDKQRFTGKQAVLGLGYSMSGKKFKMMVENYGEMITSAEATKVVNIYRETHPRLVKFWKRINEGAILALQMPDKIITVTPKVAFECENDFLYMILPSGRRLAYYQPNIEANDYGGFGISYMSMNEKHQYVRTRTYGGKLTENLVQATARDLLVDAVHNIIEDGIEVITHIHDEIVTAGHHLEQVSKHMTTLPEWASGLPIAVDGAEKQRYVKL